MLLLLPKDRPLALKGHSCDILFIYWMTLLICTLHAATEGFKLWILPSLHLNKLIFSFAPLWKLWKHVLICLILLQLIHKHKKDYELHRKLGSNIHYIDVICMHIINIIHWNYCELRNMYTVHICRFWVRKMMQHKILYDVFSCINLLQHPVSVASLLSEYSLTYVHYMIIFKSIYISGCHVCS